MIAVRVRVANFVSAQRAPLKSLPCFFVNRRIFVARRTAGISYLHFD
jgi:hypothetical protein